MSFLLFPFRGIFPCFYSMLLRFPRLFGGFGASAYTFLRNCRKYKKLEEIAPPACYNRIIKTNRIRGRKGAILMLFAIFSTVVIFLNMYLTASLTLYVVPGSFRL